MKTAPRFAILFAVISAIAATVTCAGQNLDNANVGLVSHSPYAVNQFDHVDLATGNVFGKIPLVSYPQVGDLPSLDFSIQFNSTPWYVEETCDPYMDACVAYYIPNQDLTSVGSLGANIHSNFKGFHGGTNPIYTSYSGCQEEYWPYICDTGNEWIFNAREAVGMTDETGAVHPMLWDTANLGWARATDGSGYSYYQPNGYDPFAPGSSNNTGFYTPSGNRLSYNWEYDSITETDPSGNSMFQGYPAYYVPMQYIDSVGRVIVDPMSGGSAGASSNLPVSTSVCPNLGDPNQPATWATRWVVPGPNGGTSAYTLCYTYETVLPDLIDTPGDPGSDWCAGIPDEMTSGLGESGSDFTVSNSPLPAGGMTCRQTTGLYALQSVVLPNGKAWSFLYDVGIPYTGSDGNTYYTESYGTIKTIYLPTGGTVSYTYANRFNDNFMNDLNERIVTSRTATDNVTSSSITSHYAYSNPESPVSYPNYPNSGTLTTTETTADATIVHTFTGNFNLQNLQRPIETSSRTYQGSASGTPLEEVDTYYNTTDINGGVSPALPIRAVTMKNGAVVSDDRKTYNGNFSLGSFTCWTNNYCLVQPVGGQTAVYGPLSVALDQVGQESVYDGSGNLLRTTITTPEFAVNSAYLNANQLHLVSSSEVLDGSGNLDSYTTYSYDESAYSPGGVRGKQTTINRWLASQGRYLSSHTSYNQQGMPTAVTDPKGNITYTSYDSTGIFPATIQRPTTANGVSHIDYFTHDPVTGATTSHTDENGSGPGDSAHTTSYQYDPMGRLTKTLYPPTANGTGETDVCYTDMGGALCSPTNSPYSVYTASLLSTGQFQNPSIATYDGLGRVRSSADSSGAQVVTTYDADGRVYSVTNPYYSTGDQTYGVTTHAYDALGRELAETEQDGSTRTWSYSGNTVLFTDEAHSQWLRTSDALGRLIKVLEPNGTSQAPSMETDYAFNATSDLLTVTQWGGAYGTSGAVTRNFTYDSLSRLLTSANPETGQISYAFDDDGNLQTKTDARGLAITYSYDQLNRLTGKLYSDGETPITYTYDAHSGSSFGIGFRTGMTDASGSSSWTYNARGEVMSETQAVGAVSKSSGMTYFLNGAVAQLTYPSGAVLQYSLDSAGRTTGVNDTTRGIQYAQAATYNAPGELTGLLLGYSGSFAGITEASQYQARLQPAVLSASTPSQTLMSLSYNYHYGSGDNGDLYAITNNKDNTRSQTFSYDTLNRLTQASASTLWGATFTYNAFGDMLQTGTVSGTSTNPMSMSQAVNGKHQFTLGGYSYDNDGNVLADGSNIFNCSTNGQPTTYAWNAEDQIACATGSTYTYNGDGERVKKSNGVLYWGGESSGALAESDLSGNITSEYVFFGGKRIARVDVATTSVYYYLSDHLGSSNVIANSQGQIVNESDFYPFGGERVITQSLTNQHYKFTGKERDAESGNDYFGARYYASSMGRFMSPDWSAKAEPVPYAKLADPQSLNLYSYVLNNPLRAADPDGHFGSNHEFDNIGCDPQSTSSSTPFCDPDAAHDEAVLQYQTNSSDEYKEVQNAKDQNAEGQQQTVSAEGQQFIKMHETIGGKPNLSVYTDTSGNATIGYGHLVKKGEDFSKGITRDQAESIFQADLASHTAIVNKALMFTHLPQNQFDGLVDVAFNSPRAARALIAVTELGGRPGPMAFESTLPHPNSGLLNRRYDEAIYFTYGVPKQWGVFK